jgi:glucosamine--fructose-6-phosphate aminotransferase (isomerizing)
MRTVAMLSDIQGQPASLRQVCAHQFGAGASDLQTAAVILSRAHRIVFTGMGSSFFAALPAVRHLAAHGVVAEAMETAELLHFGLETVHEGTAVVLVSRSGETIEAVRVLPELLRRGVEVIGITNVAGSELARESTCSVFLNSLPDRMIAVQSYSATLAVLLLLAEAALGRPLDSFRGSLDETCGLLDASIPSAVGQGEAWVEFLRETRVVHLMGRGPSLASVHEGALLFNEAARTPSAAMSGAQFRHGPVEIVDSRLRAIVFASQPATRTLDLALASDLEAMGAGVRVCAAPGAPAPFQPLIEIVPVQVAACALAVSKGLDPGDFRFAALVTATESGFQGPGASA